MASYRWVSPLESKVRFSAEQKYMEALAFQMLHAITRLYMGLGSWTGWLCSLPRILTYIGGLVSQYAGGDNWPSLVQIREQTESSDQIPLWGALHIASFP